MTRPVDSTKLVQFANLEELGAGSNIKEWLVQRPPILVSKRLQAQQVQD